MKFSQFLLGFSLLTLSGTSIATQVTACKPEESIRVESSVAKIKDWSHVYDAFRSNRACNGENVVEVWSAYSEVIATLLAEHWEDLDKLSRLASAHPDFKAFVIKHLSDETIPENVLNMVRQHAEHECVPGLELLCKQLGEATRDPT